jgi:hypothetical protein
MFFNCYLVSLQIIKRQQIMKFKSLMNKFKQIFNVPKPSSELGQDESNFERFAGGSSANGLSLSILQYFYTTALLHCSPLQKTNHIKASTVSRCLHKRDRNTIYVVRTYQSRHLQRNSPVFKARPSTCFR